MFASGKVACKKNRKMADRAADDCEANHQFWRGSGFAP
jgi:hypothetical protein